mgnify:FL=1
MTRTKRQMKSAMSKERRPVGTEYRELIYNGVKYTLGMYLVETTDPRQMIRLDKLLLTDKGFLLMHGTFLGQKPLKSVSVAPEYVRPAKYAEFRWNNSGFGKTPWLQFWLIVSMFTVIGLAGALSMGGQWWVMPAFYALCWGLIELKTYHNFTRRTV